MMVYTVENMMNFQQKKSKPSIRNINISTSKTKPYQIKITNDDSLFN